MEHTLFVLPLMANSLIKQAEAGEPGAQFKVGIAYLDGQGLPQDRQIGLGWLRKAAANGNETAGYIWVELGET